VINSQEKKERKKKKKVGSDPSLSNLGFGFRVFGGCGFTRSSEWTREWRWRGMEEERRSRREGEGWGSSCCTRWGDRRPKPCAPCCTEMNRGRRRVPFARSFMHLPWWPRRLLSPSRATLWNVSFHNVLYVIRRLSYIRFHISLLVMRCISEIGNLLLENRSWCGERGF
jgi:hypothetical protein